MKLGSAQSALVAATICTSASPADAFCNPNYRSSLIASSGRLLKLPCRTSNASNRNARRHHTRPYMQHNGQSDEPIPDSSRRSAMMRLTTMVSTAFLTPSQATADDEAEIFAEESDDIEEFLFDEEEEDFIIGYASPAAARVNASYTSTEVAVDPWDKFTPRVTPNDQNALSGAFANNIIPPVPARQVAVAISSKPTISSSIAPAQPPEELSTDHMDPGSLFALSFPVMVLGGAAYTFEKEKKLIANANEPMHRATGTPKVKMVMVENQPYGLDVGRRYYNGVNVVREYCDASAPKASNECVNSIAGYLEDVSSTGGTDQESQETASAIISYLDGLSNGGSRLNNGAQLQATGVAFSSYLQGLSEGSIAAPSSAESVAVYLDSLASKEKERMSTLESRMDRLESSMEDKVSTELNKIAAFLVEQSGVARNAYNGFEANESGVNAVPTVPVNGYGANGYTNGYNVNNAAGYRNGYNVNGSGGQAIGNGNESAREQMRNSPWQ